MMMDHDLFSLSLFLTAVEAILKSIGSANYIGKNGLARKLAFRVKVKCVIAVNQLINGCRMYEKKPREISDKCYLCAGRGGWFRCSRSRDLRKKS